MSVQQQIFYLVQVYYVQWTAWAPAYSTSCPIEQMRLVSQEINAWKAEKHTNKKSANCNFVTWSEEIHCLQLHWEAPCACCLRPNEVTTIRIYGRIRHHHLRLDLQFSNLSSEIGNDDISSELQPAALPSVLLHAVPAQAMRSSWRSLWMNCCSCQLLGEQDNLLLSVSFMRSTCAPGVPLTSSRWELIKKQSAATVLLTQTAEPMAQGSAIFATFSLVQVKSVCSFSEMQPRRRQDGCSFHVAFLSQWQALWISSGETTHLAGVLFRVNLTCGPAQVEATRWPSTSRGRD